MTSEVWARAARHEDAEALLPLYQDLTAGPDIGNVRDVMQVIDHPGSMICLAGEHAQICAMVTLHVLPNVTWNARPYALIENVTTRHASRLRGFGRIAMEYALSRAKESNSYKVMLLTGHRREARGFYEAVGFSADEKWGMTLRFS